MESLINQTLDELLMSPMVTASPRPSDPLQLAGQIPPTASRHDIYFHQICRNARPGLSQTAGKISGLQILGSRIETIETKMDATVVRANQNTNRIQDLHNQLKVAMAKIDDLENRSRRYNFRIRVLPETITDIPEAVSSLIKELNLDIFSYRLELDQAHRALGPPCSDGLP